MIVTPANFDASKIIVKKMAGKDNKPGPVKVFYGVEDEPLELCNWQGFGKDGAVPAILNGFAKETNYTTKEWTGNYRPGLRLVQDPRNMTDDEQSVIDFYQTVFDAIRAACEKEKSLKVVAAGLEHFVRYPKQRDNPDEDDKTKSPAIWAKCFYNGPKNKPRETWVAEDYKISLPIFDEEEKELQPSEIENKLCKAYYTLRLFTIENNPNSGGKVMSFRLTDLTVKVLGATQSGGSQHRITAKFKKDTRDVVTDDYVPVENDDVPAASSSSDAAKTVEKKRIVKKPSL